MLLCTRNARPETESVDAMRSQVFTFQILDDPEDRAQDVAIRLEQKVCRLGPSYVPLELPL